MTGDPKWNVLTADIDETLRQSREKSAADLDSTNPDLSQFAGRGGKLILYHGWNDPAISPWNTIAFYKEVQRTMGEEKADSFHAPLHESGNGALLRRPRGQRVWAVRLKHRKRAGTMDLFDSLQDWVEKGSPANDVVAAKYARARTAP